MADVGVDENYEKEDLRRMKKDMTAYVRGIIVVTMAMVAVFSILAGVGTVCIAWGAANWPPFRAFVPYQGIYQTITIITLMVGFAATVIAYAFVRGEKWAFNAAIVAILIGLVSGGVHMYYSDMIRGSTTPASLRVYVDIIALVVLFIIRMPFVWNKIDLTKPLGKNGSYTIPTGMACVAAGLGMLSTPFYAGPSHTFDGVNYVNYLMTELLVIGGVLVGFGAILLVLAKMKVPVDQWVVSLFKRTAGLFGFSFKAKAEGGK